MKEGNRYYDPTLLGKTVHFLLFVAT
jgi:hypothetical protein